MFLAITREVSRSIINCELTHLAREPIDRVELVANGSVIHTFPVEKNSSRYSGKASFDPSRYSWVAARSFLRRGPTIRLAHTGPVSASASGRMERNL